jgi:hypothetical protein
MPVALTPVQRSLAASEEEAQACKQEEKLMKELMKLTNITGTSGYKSKAPQHVQEAHSLKVRYQVLTVEMSSIKKCWLNWKQHVNRMRDCRQPKLVNLYHPSPRRARHLKTQKYMGIPVLCILDIRLSKLGETVTNTSKLYRAHAQFISQRVSVMTDAFRGVSQAL